MSYRANGFFLTEDTQSTRPGDARLSGVEAGALQKEKADFVCLGDQVKRTCNHSDLVTAITDGGNFTLIVCSYSASSIFEFATSSSSGEIQVDSRPRLNRADLPGRSPEFKKIADKLERAAGNRVPSRTIFFRKYPEQQVPRPDSQFNDLKTATSAFQACLLPAANTFNPQPQPSC